MNRYALSLIVLCAASALPASVCKPPRPVPIEERALNATGAWIAQVRDIRIVEVSVPEAERLEHGKRRRVLFQVSEVVRADGTDPQHLDLAHPILPAGVPPMSCAEPWGPRAPQAGERILITRELSSLRWVSADSGEGTRLLALLREGLSK